MAFPPVRQQEVLQLVNALLEGIVEVVGVVGVVGVVEVVGVVAVVGVVVAGVVVVVVGVVGVVVVGSSNTFTKMPATSTSNCCAAKLCYTYQPHLPW